MIRSCGIETRLLREATRALLPTRDPEATLTSAPDKPSLHQRCSPDVWRPDFTGAQPWHLPGLHAADPGEPGKSRPLVPGGGA